MTQTLDPCELLAEAKETVERRAYNRILHKHSARRSYEWRVANDVGNQELRMNILSEYFRRVNRELIQYRD